MKGRSGLLSLSVLLAIATVAWIVSVQRQPTLDRRTRLRLMPRTLGAGEL